MDTKLYSYYVTSKTLVQEYAQKSSDIFLQEAQIIRNTAEIDPIVIYNELRALNQQYRELCKEYDGKIEQNFADWETYEKSLS